MGVLKVRVNGVWEEIGVPEPPLDEVWVGAGPPDPVGTYEVWIDNTVDPAVLYFQDQIGAWHELDTGNEVTVGPTDPYIAEPNSADELWVDTRTGAPGVLKVRLGGVWQELFRFGGVAFEQQYGQEPFAGTLNVAARADHTHGTPKAEVVVDDTMPPAADHDVWYDTNDPATLKVSVGGTWVPVSSNEAPMDEVWIGSVVPDPAIGTYELWIDTGVVPPVLKHEMPTGSGAWIPLMEAEVHVGVADPYLANPNSRAELWHDTSIGQSGKLKARWANSWHPVAEFTESEVEIGSVDPTTIPGMPPGSTELWVNTGTTPATLLGWVNGAWQQLTGPDPMVPQEVHIGPSDPMDVTTELWYDNTNSPKGVLYANNEGVWEAVGGANEVTVGNTDPYAADPTSEDEFWYDTSKGVPGTLWVRTGRSPTDPTDTGQWTEVAPLATSVSYGTSYGQEPRAGTLNTYAHEDHQHGTPPPEVHVGDTDPYTYAVPMTVDLWYDTSV